MQVSGNSFSVPTYKESKLSKNDPYGIVHWLFLMLRTSNVVADNVHIKLVLFSLLTYLNSLINIKSTIAKHYLFSINESKTKNGIN